MPFLTSGCLELQCGTFLCWLAVWLYFLSLSALSHFLLVLLSFYSHLCFIIISPSTTFYLLSTYFLIRSPCEMSRLLQVALMVESTTAGGAYRSRDPKSWVEDAWRKGNGNPLQYYCLGEVTWTEELACYTCIRCRDPGN